MRKCFLDIMTCRACELKSKCTNSPAQRRISHWWHQGRIDQMNEAMKAHPDGVLIRKQTVEHPYRTIKSWMGSTLLLTRRFKNVGTEMSLHVLAYNLKPMMAIFGEVKLMAAMTEV